MEIHDIYARELLHYRLGFALWLPEPSPDYGPVQLADVGYIADGKFHRLFNAGLPADHPSHERLGVPEGFEPLTGMEISSVDRFIDPGPLHSETVRQISIGAGLSGSTVPAGASFELSHSSSRGAILMLHDPLLKQSIEHYRSDILKSYVLKHNKSWYAFANRTLRRGIPFEHIQLVTHCYKTTSSWAAAVASNVSGSFEISLSGGPLGIVNANVSASVGRKRTGSVVSRSGGRSDSIQVPTGEDGKNDDLKDQTMFVQGWRAKPDFKMFRVLQPGLIQYGSKWIRSARRSRAESPEPPTDVRTSVDESDMDVGPALLHDIESTPPPSSTNRLTVTNPRIFTHLPPLGQAAFLGDISTVLALLASGADPTAPGVLHAACSSGDETLVTILLNAGADVTINQQSDTFGGVLHGAVREGNESLVRLLVEHGADLNARDHTWCTPLYVAVYHKRVNIVRYLLDAGSRDDRTCEGCRTALDLACNEAYEDAVRLILDRDVESFWWGEKTTRSYYLSSGLYQAMQYRCCSIDVIRSLLEHGADVQWKYNGGLTERSCTVLEAAAMVRDKDVLELFFSQSEQEAIYRDRAAPKRKVRGQSPRVIVVQPPPGSY